MKKFRFLEMNIRDLIAIAVVVAVSAVGFLLIGLNRGEAGEVVITLNGSEYGAYPINADRTLTIKSDSGVNTVVIENGTVYVKDADCPDKYCVRQGRISRPGESVVCLPHKLVVGIKANSAEIDAVAK